MCLCSMTHGAGTPVCQAMVTWTEFLYARAVLPRTVLLGDIVVVRARGNDRNVLKGNLERNGNPEQAGDSAVQN